MASFCGGGLSTRNAPNLIPGVSQAQLETPGDFLSQEHYLPRGRVINSC